MTLKADFRKISEIDKDLSDIVFNFLAHGRTLKESPATLRAIDDLLDERLRIMKLDNAIKLLDTKN